MNAVFVSVACTEARRLCHFSAVPHLELKLLLIMLLADPGREVEEAA